ncbi:ABC transporter substrate-binding protein [Streptomyces sp. NPDC094034]|uniref:ABC transporter substrate-binding protein n=1 Tax=Streptomyces sp. NPDC094034 TaxID=3155309 RepID=UPI003320F3A1
MGLLKSRRIRWIPALALGACMTLAAPLLAACGNASDNGSAGGQVIFADYGGVTDEGYKAAYFKDFTKETGIKVVTANADMARYIAMAKAGRSQWDTIDADGFAVVDLADHGLVQKLPASVPRGDTVTGKYRDYAAGGYTQSFVLAYRKSAFKTAPTSWADVWDTKKFPGKRGWPNFYVGTAEAALLADGAQGSNLYPLDFDRAFAKLDKLKPSLTVYDSYAAVTQGLQAGSVDMALLPNGRAAVLAKEDPDVAIMWEQNIFYPWSGLTIPKGAPDAEGTARLLTYMQDPKRQAAFAEKTYYGPTVRAAYDLIDPKIAAELPGTPEHEALAVTVDTAALAAQTDEYIKRYSAWVAQ